MKLEQWDTTTDLLEWSNAKSEKPFTSKDEGQQELSLIVSGNAIWRQYLTGLNVVIPHDLKIMLLDSSANDLIATAHTKTCTWVLLQLNSYYHSLPHTHTHTHTNWKQPKCPLIDDWINKLQYINITEYYSRIKWNELLNHKKKWMKPEWMLLSKIS